MKVHCVLASLWLGEVFQDRWSLNCPRLTTIELPPIKSPLWVLYSEIIRTLQAKAHSVCRDQVSRAKAILTSLPVRMFYSQNIQVFLKNYKQKSETAVFIWSH